MAAVSEHAKEKHKAAMRSWYARNAEAAKVRMKEYYQKNKEYIIARNHAYQQANPELKSQWNANWRAKSPVRTQAANALNLAVRHGVLLRQPCWVCGKKAHAHHSSYAPDMWLFVTWLCPLHHKQVHKEAQQWQL